MRKIKVKRLAYYHLGTGETIYGGETYDGKLDNTNILGSIYMLGKNEWCPNAYGYAMYQTNNKGELVYRITVETFYQYQKTAFDLAKDNIKRILGL